MRELGLELGSGVKGAGNTEGCSVLGPTQAQGLMGPLKGWLGWLLSRPRLNLALGGCGGQLPQGLSRGLRMPFTQLLLG